jgi:23S rRNA pseudoU1915 N3-methylase RlmH
MDTEPPGYIQDFFNINKEGLKKIYVDNLKNEYGILLAVLSETKNKVNIIFLNSEKIKEMYGEKMIDNLQEKTMINVCDDDNKKVYWLQITL